MCVCVRAYACVRACVSPPARGPMSTRDLQRLVRSAPRARSLPWALSRLVRDARTWSPAGGSGAGGCGAHRGGGRRDRRKGEETDRSGSGLVCGVTGVPEDVALSFYAGNARARSNGACAGTAAAGTALPQRYTGQRDGEGKTAPGRCAILQTDKSAMLQQCCWRRPHGAPVPPEEAG